MKTKIRRLAALLLVFSVFCTVPTPVLAVNTNNISAPRASYYISGTYASISNNNGSVKVSFDIVATRKMTSLGATMIRIKDSSGATVKTFYSSSTSGMMGYNCTIYNSSVTYNGSANKQYYAVVSFKAEDSTGSDTDSYITDYT